MIEEVRDLTREEKRNRLELRGFLIALSKSLPAIVIASAAMILYGLFIEGGFIDAFSPDEGAATSGRFLTGLILLAAVFIGVYAFCEKKSEAPRNFNLVTLTIVITFVASMTAARYINVYAMPLALSTLIVVELLDRRTAMLSTVSTAVFVLYTYFFGMQEASPALFAVVSSVICNTIGGVAINYLVDKHLNRLKFIIGAAVSTLCVQPLVILGTVASGDYSINILLNVVYSYGASLAAVLVFMPIVAVFESAFNIADDFRLNELTNLNHPLLKRLASEAPGTFNHSLVVGNLCEACAGAIGENSLLARAAGYYHDVGKLKAPVYFTENQSTYNPHDELIPEVSVSMITSHTVFGEILAKQYHLPPEIVAICREHHGTSPVGYFYRKALNMTEEGELPVGGYTYSGPRPQSKIAAIVMIADTVEAALRASMPGEKADFIAKINALIDEKTGLHQFDECPITLKDLNTVRETIIEVLPSIHHSRISYDKK